MTHPKRADHFKKWSQMMLEQATVPERVQYKSTSTGTKSNKGGGSVRNRRRKRFQRKRRRKVD